MLKMLMEDFKKLSKVSNKTPLNGQLGDLGDLKKIITLSYKLSTEACKRAYYSCEILIPSLLMPITDVPTND